MPSKFNIRSSLLWQIILFVGILFCATLPIQLFLLFTSSIVAFLPYRRYWLWTSLLITAYTFFFFSPTIMKISGNAIGSMRRMAIPLPEVVQKSNIQNPVITIVIPAYNYEKFVGKAVETAATQKFSLPYEVVVVEDCSSDDTLAQIMLIAQKYPHVAVYRQLHNRGLITTKNAGITLAKGKWIYNLDADDHLPPDTLSTLYSLTNPDDGGDLVFSAVHTFGAEQNTNYFCHGANTLNYNCVPNNILYRKSDWQELGPYDYLFQKGVEDWDFSMAFKQAGKKIIMAEHPVHFALIKEESRNTEANKHTNTLWWYMQAKYAHMLTLKQRAEMLLCGFYRFYCPIAIKHRFKNYFTLYKQTQTNNI